MIKPTVRHCERAIASVAIHLQNPSAIPARHLNSTLLIEQWLAFATLTARNDGVGAILGGVL